MRRFVSAIRSGPLFSQSLTKSEDVPVLEALNSLVLLKLLTGSSAEAELLLRRNVQLA